MAKTFAVVVNQHDDERTVQQLVNILRANNRFSKQLRAFAETVSEDAWPQGLKFQPTAGQLLVCHFGIGFQQPEIVKTRPVLVVSQRNRFSRELCTVIPISSRAPREPQPYHYQLPSKTVPGTKYKEAWLKGDLVQTVGLHRLDRIKIGYRNYISPMVSEEILKEARRCILHSQGMHLLTEHWV